MRLGERAEHSQHIAGNTVIPVRPACSPLLTADFDERLIATSDEEEDLACSHLALSRCDLQADIVDAVNEELELACDGRLLGRGHLARLEEALGDGLEYEDKVDLWRRAVTSRRRSAQRGRCCCCC